jgi:hypothetical protein
MMIDQMSYLWDGTATLVVEKQLLSEHKQPNYIGYQMNEAENTQTTGTPKSLPPELSQREQQIINYLQRDLGRELTPQEVHHALKQARDIGHL